MHPRVEAAWKLVPKPVQDAIASTVDRAKGVTPPPPPLPDLSRPIRMLVGPVNYAGQGYRWSRAAESTGEVSAVNYVHAGNNLLQYPADYTVTWRTAEHSRAWQRSMLDAIATNYTHVLIEACFPILGGMFSGDLRRQTALLQERGVRVGIVGHGTDVRLPSTHLESTPWSLFVDSEDWVPFDLAEKAVADNLAAIADLDVPTFVSTAGLLVDLPRAHFLGVVIDQEQWINDEPLLERERIRVIHAPTNAHVKGTPLIVPVAQKLHDEGLIEFIQLDRVPNHEMPAVVASADVVLDQFRVGDYGVAACESMTAGRVVLAHVTEQARREVEGHAGMTLPIPETTPDTLEHMLRDIAVRRDHYRGIAATGREFVRRVHNGDFSRAQLMTHFLSA
ncbi:MULTISPECIES: glycosyltransferase [Microbacterium]|uniref:Glycosyltransferase n=1 Tax=Microbacterium sufflavum TaxID=2851649 RepID=A0ABY4IFX3_9MICO|nr:MULTISPECIES: glycosyltransferase [Microbacterium]UPL11685.1 glycosyltransferase [Microbacterium sufflavum]